MSKQDAFITEVMTMTNMFDKYYAIKSNETFKSYFDNGYNTSITQPDLDNLFPGVTLAQFQAGMTMMNEINNFLNNLPVTQADYLSTINQLRINGLV